MAFDVTALCRAAKTASGRLALLSGGEKNRALAAMRDAIKANAETILAENERDLAAAEANGIKTVMVDRLRLTQQRIDGICSGIDEVIALPDPVGRVLSGGVNADGLKIIKTAVPLGVIAVIYESRPNVGPDVAALCLKAGSVCLLRGGKEAYHSNKILCEVMRGALLECGLPPDFVCFVDSVERSDTQLLMRQNDYLSCIIPRGSAGLIAAVRENSSVPVIETGAGVCAVYIDRAAELDMAVEISANAKLSRPSVCNSAETLLVHADLAERFLPAAYAAMDEKKTQFRCCPVSYAVLDGRERVVKACEEDYYTEFNDYIIAVKVVKDADEAIDHINEHGTHHSDAIVTADLAAAEAFLHRVDSAAVYVNASTRFTDGGVFGLGAEIGISTQKLHARGPMGLGELVSYKYTIYGSGQIR